MSDRINPVMARQREEAEQARQEHQRTENAKRDRDRLVAAGNLVEALGERFELEQKADKEYLKRGVKAMAAYKALLAERGRLELLAQLPAGLAGHDRDVWQKAGDVREPSCRRPDLYIG